MPSAEAVEAAFYAALSQGDLSAVMSLWADDDAIVCSHPSGPRLIGRTAVEASFRDILSHGGLHVRPSRVHSVRTADMSVHSLIEVIVVSGPGGTQEVEVIATNIFVRTPQGWRLLMHHAGVAEEEDDDADDESSDDPDIVQLDASVLQEEHARGFAVGASSAASGTADNLADLPPTDRRRLH